MESLPFQFRYKSHSFGKYLTLEILSLAFPREDLFTLLRRLNHESADLAHKEEELIKTLSNLRDDQVKFILSEDLDVMGKVLGLS